MRAFTFRDTVSETINSGPMFITDLFQNKDLAYFNPKWNILHFFQFFFATMFLFLFFMKAQKTVLKSSILICHFFLSLSATPTAKSSQELNIHFIDSCTQWSVILYLGKVLRKVAFIKVKETDHCIPIFQRSNTGE